ncbi:MAG: serine protease [Pseudomonadota bacterium]|nr:serine protease [Pseudomonadota bacterium]
MAQAQFRDYVRLVRGFNTFTRMVRCDCINGYAVGRKVTSGKVTGDVAIAIFVNKKMGLRRLPLANRIPKVLRLPSEKAKDGVLDFITDVREARFSSLEYIARERPAPSGISIGHVNITAGTLGGLVRDRDSGVTAILSNNHVLADSNEAAIGDPILQPGPHDGGTDPADHIANLTRFVPIDFAADAENRVDGAIATPLSPSDVIWNTKDIGAETPVNVRHLGESDLGRFVHKTGRTTEHTQGFVDAVFATVQVKYDLFQKATFVDQIIVSQSPVEEAFSDGGDSGSLVYDSDNSVVGLLFAGSEGSEDEPATTIVNPMNYVLEKLNIELLSSGDHPSA